MKYLLALLAACALSVLAYLLLFGFVVSRPLVVDQVSQFMAKKLAYAAQTPHPKIFIVAASNARFSHSCAVLENLLGRPCVNMGIAGDVGLDWLLDLTEHQLAPGDFVYIPLEYDQYPVSRARLFTGMDGAYRFRHDKASLAVRGPEGIVRAAFMFSLPTLIQSLGEMTFQAAGVHRRFNLGTMDRQGDEIGHGDAQAAPYRAAVLSIPQSFPSSDMFDNPEGVQTFLGHFLDWCRDHGVAVTGGLPTTFQERIVPDDVIAKLRAFYAAHGADFVTLPNRSQYPRSDFYDSGYHLRESAQHRHTAALAVALRPLLPVAPR